MQKEDKTIPFLDVLLIIQEDGSLGHKVYRKPTHTDRYLHYNSFHHPSIKNSVCKTLINRAKTICEVDNIEGELEHLRSVLKMNGYPKKFIDYAMKTRHTILAKTNCFDLSAHIRNPVCTAFPVNVVWYILVKLAEISHYVLKNIRLTARKPS